MNKSERALQLREKGLTPTQIAERLGTTPGSVSVMILRAKERREKHATDLALQVGKLAGELRNGT